MPADQDQHDGAAVPQPDRAPRDGLISAVFADKCRVWNDGQEWVCTLRGRLTGQARPVVGDRVDYFLNPDGSGTVTSVHPRRTCLLRATSDRKRRGPAPPHVLAANVEQMVIVAAVRNPPFRSGLVDRFLVAAIQAGVAPLLCITKLDLDRGGSFHAIQESYTALGIPVLGTLTHERETLHLLAQALAGKMSVFVGHSGVGKTSLLTALSGRTLPIGGLDPRTHRGRHTTSTALLIPLLEGGFVIDSPGTREFGLHGVSSGLLAELFPGFAPYVHGCSFRDCLHKSEPGCAVRNAVAQGHIATTRYEGYLRLLEQTVTR